MTVSRRLGARATGLHRDERGLVTAFVLRYVVIFAILVMCIEEGGQIALAQVHASNAAGAAAQAGADEYYQSKNANRAEAAAVAAMTAKDPQADMVSFSVAKDGVVTVTASQKAATLFVQHVPFIKDHLVQRSTETEFHSLS
jgi:hypothetical protein